MRPWTIVTDDLNGRSRSGLAAVRALASAGYRVAVTTPGGSSLAASSRDCSRSVTVPVAGTPGHAEAVGRLTEELGCVAVFLSSDAAVMSVQPESAALIDKQKLAELLGDDGLRAVPGETFDGGAALLRAASRLSYPLIVKPTVKDRPDSTASLRVDAPAGLHAVATVGDPLTVQPFLTGQLRAVAGVMWDGELRACVHQAYTRIWPTGAGVASAAVTVGPDLETERHLVRLLAAHRGVFQVQLIDDHVLDVNPRVYGSLPLAVAAGANLPAVVCRSAVGQPGDLVRGRSGVRYRWLEGDLRSLLAQVRRGELSPLAAALELRPHRGTAHSVESLRDPRPSVLRVRQASGRAR